MNELLVEAIDKFVQPFQYDELLREINVVAGLVCGVGSQS